MKISPMFVILPALAIILAGCSSSMNATDTPAPATGTETGDEVQGKMPASDEIIDVGMSDYKFDKSEIRVKAGSTVTLRFKNTGGTHDFVIDELNVKSRMLSKDEMQEVNVTIPTDAAGKTYEFYCSVPGHRKMGMVGKFIIE